MVWINYKEDKKFLAKSGTCQPFSLFPGILAVKDVGINLMRFIYH